jgi:hypothetical protein
MGKVEAEPGEPTDQVAALLGQIRELKRQRATVTARQIGSPISWRRAPPRGEAHRQAEARKRQELAALDKQIESLEDRIKAVALVGRSIPRSSPIEGDENWSLPMSKAEIMTRLKLKPRAFATFAQGHGLKRIGRQLWQIRLNAMDAATRRMIEKGR